MSCSWLTISTPLPVFIPYFTQPFFISFVHPPLLAPQGLVAQLPQPFLVSFTHLPLLVPQGLVVPLTQPFLVSFTHPHLLVPQGLVVPVIRNVETMNYSSIEKNLHSLGEKVYTIIVALDI